VYAEFIFKYQSSKGVQGFVDLLVKLTKNQMILAVGNEICNEYDVYKNYEMLLGKKKPKEPNVEPSQKNMTVNVEPSQELEEKKIPVYVDETKYWKIEAYKLEVQLYFLETEILAIKENQKEEAEKLEAQLKLPEKWKADAEH
jgi:hypothetical protein